MSRNVILVTGSGKRRLGWFIAEAFAERGYAIAVHYLRSGREAARAGGHIRGLGAEAEAFQADLANAEAVRALVRATVERFGRLDVLVNCAAIWETQRFEDVTAADVRRHFEVNVLGTFLCAQQAGLVMVGQPEGGCIINFGDWAEA
ncbi:MAG: SDR family NAD(P)-dependent oxidoreductase, partial [Isosphaeraceae bacterium]|nr:SDR family NAD(P)-dependent oxidoreductase [Isosphaeraceae bacterium]